VENNNHNKGDEGDWGGLNTAVNSWAIGTEMWFCSLLQCRPILRFIYTHARNVANYVG
jgi:hypothetical protein